MWLLGLISSLVLLSALAVISAVLYCLLKLPRFPPKVVASFLEKSRQAAIAHRGTQPENTLAGIRRSKELGASGVEVDVQFTKDGYPVLIHDKTIDRTSDGRGNVGEMTLQELKELDFGSKFESEFVRERIPTLEEAVSLCEELDLQIYLEFKGSAEPRQAADIMKKLLARRPQLNDRIAVISFSPQVIYAVHKANPSILCGLSIESCHLEKNTPQWWRFLLKPIDLLLYWSAVTWLWRLLGVSLVTINKNNIRSGSVLYGRCDVTKWKRRGVDVVTWTVDDEDEQRYFRDVLQIPYMTNNVQAD